MPLLPLLLTTCAALVGATLTLDSFPNTVLAPLSAATRSFPAAVHLPAAFPAHSSARFTGSIVSPHTESLNFSATTDASSQLRVWADNHILLDCARNRSGGAPCLSISTLPVAAGAPVALRVEFTHASGTTPQLAFFWQGNATAFAEVPAAALSPTVPAWETSRVEMRDRLQNPPVPWQTWTQNMAAHVLMPQGLALDATLRNLDTGVELGNIVPWRSFDPAQVRPGLHSLNGSDYTHFELSRWGALDCNVDFSSTVVGGDLVWVVESSGADCERLAVVFHGIIKWGYSGDFSPISPKKFTAVLPGFADVTVALVSGVPVAPLQQQLREPACNLTGSWCCGETQVWEDASGGVTSTAGYGTGAGNISPSNNVSMFFSNAPSRHFYGYLSTPACDTVHWLNDGSQWTRAPPPPPPPPPPFSPFVVRLGGADPVVVATGPTALALNASAARALIALAAARASAWLNAAQPPGHRDAYEPLSAVLLWDTVYTPYLTPVVASSRLWVCTGANAGCSLTGYTIFNWDMPMVAWTFAGLGLGWPSDAPGFAYCRDMAYAQLIEDAYTRTLMGFVPNFSSGVYSSGDRTQPPLFGFVAMQLYKIYGETWLLEALYDPLLSYLNFLWEYRRGAGVHAGSDGRVALFGWGSNDFLGADRHNGACTKAAAGYESGLDDSPMWDEAGWSPCEGGLGLMELYDAGLTGLYLSESYALIAMAEVIGKGEAPAVATLRARANATAAALNAHLWNDTRGFYNNVLWDGTPSVHLAPTSYYPLMAGPASGVVPLERAAAMVATLASPLGMCLNETAFGPGGPFAAITSRWVRVWDAAGEPPGTAAAVATTTDIATCASEACIATLVSQQYPQTPSAGVEAVVFNVSAAGTLPPPALNLVPLANWWSPLRRDTALTNDTLHPPYGDPSYTLLRIEGYCLPTPTPTPTHTHTHTQVHTQVHTAPPSSAPPTVPLTSWRKGSDTAACSSPACEEEMNAAGYAPLGTLCHAIAAGGLEDYPCRYGAPSISRDDPQFDRYGTGYYWRGRIWPATEGSLYWALMPWGDSLVPGLGQARQALAQQARRLANFHWGAWGAVCENAHALLGTCAEMRGQGSPGDDDPLLNWSGIGPYLSIVESRAAQAKGYAAQE